MARRRLLTILAGSAVLSATLAGPAAATELVGARQDSVVEVTAEAVVMAVETDVVETVETVVVETVVVETVGVVEETAEATEDALAEVTGAVEEAVAPSPSEAPAPAPSPTTEEQVAPGDSSSDERTEGLVVAGDVGAAPTLAFLTGTGGSAPVVRSRLDVPPPTPAVVPAPPSSEEVPAPQVAPAPAEVAADPAASMLARAASRAVHDEGLPIVVLVAIASLLAAGSATVREARIAA